MRHRLRITAPAALFAVAAAAGGAYVTVLASRLTFLLDDWGYIFERRAFDADAFFAPANEHLVAAEVAVWKVLLPVFGLSSTLPYRIFSTAFFLAAATLLFVWARRRIGPWPALLATIPLLFLGAGFEDLLWFTSGVSFLGAGAFGLGMLLALDRRDRRGDQLACACLIASMLWGSLWVAFAAGAAVDLALRRRERRPLSRAFVLAVPLGLYALWWLLWGHEAESALSFANLAGTPRYVLDSVAAAIAAALGLAIPVASAESPNGLDWGRPLAVALIGLGVWRLRTMRPIPVSFWVVLGVGFAFWAIAGLELKEGRAASASRYQVPGVIFLTLICVELVRGLDLRRRLLGPVLVVLAASVLSNVVFLHQAYESFHVTTRTERAGLAALEIARDHVDPDLILDEPLAGTPYLNVRAGSYLSGIEAFGSPAYSPAELARSPETARANADRVLAAALAIELRRSPAARLDDCRPLDGEALMLPPGGMSLRAGRAPIEGLKLARFAAGEPPVSVPGRVPAGQVGVLAIPRDRSSRPWWMFAVSSPGAAVCDLPRGPGSAADSM